MAPKRDPEPGLSGPNSSARASLRLRVSGRAESVLRAGHPWLFAESVRSQNRAGQTGELAVVYDGKDKFLAIGLFDAESPIRVRVLHTGKPRVIDRAFWVEQLEQSLQGRQGHFDEETTGFRWIHGESDGWPGLVLDRYGTTLVVKLYTAAWLPWLKLISELLVSRLNPERIVLRLSRNIQEVARRFLKSDGEILQGPPLTGPVEFTETGLRFEADVIHGQKTGFFLDQRENRRKVETLAAGNSVLNAFSFSGGFSLYAARGGARSVVDLDISAHALKAAQRNFWLNSGQAIIRKCGQEQIQGDAFEWLSSNVSRQFDVVVLDPPSLARRETERPGAIGAYNKLASLGINHLRRRGILLACSCSAHVSESEFMEAVRRAAVKSRRPFKEIARTGQPPDHPALFPETQYLKALYLQFEREASGAFSWQ